MIIFRIMFMLSFLFYSVSSLSGGMLTSPPRETIARGEESCIEGKDSQCKPWVVHIYNQVKLGQYKKTISSCTGSLIAPNYILTASHCYYDPKEHNPNISFEGYIIKDYKKK
ncbi:trypsin-like serine protease [Xenorhabdus innexi]|uniref:Trypsin n=1 Tax=Xenorhabdus innexi TaxID=290109 RepID=A0A1N6MQK9_9GAMM|nr:trypsin-like serine protease [Xenorhabdus innexi]PHM35565.1 trypsin [Xenorhabdus innexi]SIP71135.1 exported hypothetical protein [Xenorhabdus innexi]